MRIYKPEPQQKKQSERAAKRQKLTQGMSRPLKVRYGGGKRHVFVYADSNHQKGETTIISVRSMEALGTVKTIDVQEFLRAVRMIMMVREIYEAMPSLFISLNEDAIAIHPSKDHFGIQDVVMPKKPTTKLTKLTASNSNGNANQLALEED